MAKCKKCGVIHLEKCQIIFMDINMPFMNGHQASKILKSKMKTLRLEPVPIIANSANKVELRQLPSHFDEMLPKPIERKVLLGIIKRWVRKRCLRREPSAVEIRLF